MDVRNVGHVEGLHYANFRVDGMNDLPVFIRPRKLLILSVQNKLGVAIVEINKAIILNNVNSFEHVVEMLLKLLNVGDL